MAATLQITTLVATFALAVFLGTIFDTGYFQASIHANETMGDKPLPYVSSMLFHNHRALFYVMLFPWIGFAGVPLLSRTKKHSDNDLFFLRFAAFAMIESLLTVFLLLFLLLPFFPYYMLMDMRRNTMAETVVIIGFWILVIVPLFLILRRARVRRTPNQS